MTTPEKLPLTSGSHSRPTVEQLREGGPYGVPACAMERASILWARREGLSAEETARAFTDHLACVSPIIASACRSFNDRCGSSAVGDARREAIFTEDFLVALLDTKGGEALERRRRYALADWSIRVATPRMAALSPTLAPWAEKLRALPEIVDAKTLTDSREVTFAMREAAWAIWRNRWAEYRKKYAGEAAAEAAAAAEAEAAEAAEAAAAAAAAEAAAAAAEAARSATWSAAAEEIAQLEILLSVFG